MEHYSTNLYFYNSVSPPVLNQHFFTLRKWIKNSPNFFLHTLFTLFNTHISLSIARQLCLLTHSSAFTAKQRKKETRNLSQKRVSRSNSWWFFFLLSRLLPPDSQFFNNIGWCCAHKKISHSNKNKIYCRLPIKKGRVELHQITVFPILITFFRW